MDKRYANSIYGSVFPQGNISPDHFQNTIPSNTSTFFDTGNVMLPSPVYGAKELNAYVHQQQQLQLQTQQEDTTSIIYTTQIPTSINDEINSENLIKQEVSQDPQNEFKPKVFIYLLLFM